MADFFESFSGIGVLVGMVFQCELRLVIEDKKTYLSISFFDFTVCGIWLHFQGI